MLFLQTDAYKYDGITKSDNKFEEMGNVMTANQGGSLVAATLNFSGISLSPFEYHDCSVEKDYLSEKFKKLMDIQIKDPDFVWNVGKIDKLIQKERYAPVYRTDVGVVGGKLVNRAEFEANWDSEFKKALKNVPDFKPSEVEIKNIKLFDWLSYRTFVNIVYQKNAKDTIPIEQFKGFDPKQYLQWMEQWHNKEYLDNRKKIRKVCKFLQKADVVILQEAVQGPEWQKVEKDFGMVTRPGSTSMILYRKQMFPENEDEAFKKKYLDIIYWNNDTVFIKKGNHLLIAAHLTSKDHNKTQAAKMFEDLKAIKKSYPQLQIIMGIDSNHYLNSSLMKQLNFVPNDEKGSTTSKKRTWIQLQSNKANVIVMEIKDHLLTTRNVKAHFIGTLEGQWTNEKVYLPTDTHPFDHFAIVAKLI